jgi:hypothetical protein
MRSHCIIACLLVAGAIQLKGATFQKPVLTGEYRAYHTITFTWDGPYAKEDSTLNPFTDYRLVLRMHYEESGGEFYSVPGYFAADGNAANSGATSGNKWKAHFNTSWPGRYSYKVFFHTGTNIALDTNMANGTPIEGINNDTGFVFYADSGDKEISTNKPPPDLRGYGNTAKVISETCSWRLKKALPISWAVRHHRKTCSPVPTSTTRRITARCAKAGRRTYRTGPRETPHGQEAKARESSAPSTICRLWACIP